MKFYDYVLKSLKITITVNNINNCVDNWFVIIKVAANRLIKTYLIDKSNYSVNKTGEIVIVMNKDY